MRAYVGIVDDTGLRAFLPDEESTRRLMVVGCRSACVWAAIEADGVREIEAELRSGHRSEALSLLLNQAVELLPILPLDRLSESPATSRATDTLAADGFAPAGQRGTYGLK